jgi:hypothetical protein
VWVDAVVAGGGKDNDADAAAALSPRWQAPVQYKSLAGARSIDRRASKKDEEKKKKHHHHHNNPQPVRCGVVAGGPRNIAVFWFSLSMFGVGLGAIADDGQEKMLRRFIDNEVFRE